MPIYAYRCLQCESVGEAYQSIHSDALTECPECGGEYRRVLSPPTVFDSTPKTLGALADRRSDRDKGWVAEQEAKGNVLRGRPEGWKHKDSRGELNIEV